MARPVKRTVDYFAHDAGASGGKTVTILENHFGFEGYAVWFKLLEIISVTNNHVIDLRNSTDIEYLSGKMRVKPERLLEILDKIAFLKAIDPDLWKQRIIWSQNFVDRLSEVYDHRKQDKPQRPQLDNKVVNTNINSVSTAETPLSTTETTQSKVKETKGNKRREDDDPLPPTTPAENLSSSSSENQEDDLSKDGNIFTLYEQEIGDLTPGISELLKDAETEYPAEWISGAIKLAATQNKRNWSYIKGILDNCKAENHAPCDGKGKAPPGRNDDPDKYVKGRYGHVVKRS